MPAVRELKREYRILGRRIRLYTWVLASAWTLLVAASAGWNLQVHRQQKARQVENPPAAGQQQAREMAVHLLLWGLGLTMLALASRRLAAGAETLRESEERLLETSEALRGQAVQLEQEIAVRQLSEEALLYSTELLRSTIDSMEELVLVLDREGLLTSIFQPGGAPLSPPPALRHYRQSGLPDSLIDPMEDALRTLLEQGTPQSFDCTIETPDGTRWYTATAAVRTDRDGRFAGTTVVCRDITSRKQAELALLESEQRFAVFMRHLPLAAFIKDPQGTICYANEYLEDLLGVDSLVGRRIEELVPKEVAAKISADDAQARAEGLTLVQDTIRDVHGDDRTFESYKFPIRVPGGAVLLGCIAMDVTERKRFAASLALKQQQLEELNASLERRVSQTVAELRQKDELLIQQGRLAAMGEMINNIAHQWRQPLNNLGLLVQNLQLAEEAGELTSEGLREEVRDAMEVIMFMSRTIDDFRNFFRHDKDRSPLPVARLVAKSLDFMAAVLKSNAIEWELEKDDAVMALGYPNEFSQVLLNILNNARDILLERHIRQPRIAVRVYAAKGRACVSISDNGGGIPAEVLPRIFDPYFTTRDPGKGTGIGLYMSKVIIEKHMQGRLSAHNTAEGAEFLIEL